MNHCPCEPSNNSCWTSLPPICAYRTELETTTGGVSVAEKEDSLFIVKRNGVTTKLFVLYLQRDEGNPRLNSEHFAVILKDTNAIDNGILLDIGTYDHLGTDSKQTSLEIPGPDDYIVQATSLVQDIHNGLICLDASGEFWNPYQQAFYTVTAKLENYPIGQDVKSTPYGYLLD